MLTITCVMTDEHTSTLAKPLKRAPSSRRSRATLQFVMGQLARLPTRRDLAKTALGIIISAAALVILWAEAFWRL